ncbi:HAMP domain-containing sensor histidine kinase [Paenibacillus flagellatus]|uniref:histidine kinase n=1 Tax=Paenibacillus flagellatus TaxID=2211139 RepID=A0A2V5K9F4_9BACL|nr:HAMP domain-containing sensor histidine kinase [Paenibacillus flagellatus]PYI56119.1 histidine kinase [Paenibacillus flagellatus]
MAKIVSYLRLKPLTLLQSFVALNVAYLVVVLTAIVFEFEWAERARQRFADHPAGTDWVLTAQIIAILLTVGAGLVLMAGLFYKLKLKQPLDLLMSASESISANDLEFRLSYDAKDEMGELCRAFEKMRGQLESNFKALWRSVEERNRLNAIFAHDLRTPLSIMKGYFELITTYLPQKRMSEEKLLDTLRTMETHIGRMERYVEAMNSIQKLEDRPVVRRETDADGLIARLDDGARRMAERHGKTYDSSKAADTATVDVDPDLVMQVFDNMIANGTRYATGQVNVDYEVRDGLLSITVADDGPGFSAEELQKAVLPFYRGDVPDASGRQGLGLYVCKVLCDKHGGCLAVANRAGGGGNVTASFRVRVDQ